MTMSCLISAGAPTPTVQWLKEGIVLQPTLRIRIDEVGVLKILDVSYVNLFLLSHSLCVWPYICMFSALLWYQPFSGGLHCLLIKYMWTLYYARLIAGNLWSPFPLVCHASATLVSRVR